MEGLSGTEKILIESSDNNRGNRPDQAWKPRWHPRQPRVPPSSRGAKRGSLWVWVPWHTTSSPSRSVAPVVIAWSIQW